MDLVYYEKILEIYFEIIFIINILVFNSLTLEMIKLVKILIIFGNYTLKLQSTKDKIKSKNKEFFSLLKVCISIFEFDKTYPEARLILVDKR